MTLALRCDGVSFAYRDTTAISDLSFSLAPGERVALLGKNGAGKSTLVRLITGLVQPAAGTVWVGDWETRGRRPERLARRVGSVFQHADQQLFASSIRADVEFGPRALGLSKTECARRAEAALAALDLLSLADEHPYDVPPPWRKLVALAGALALEPLLLVLDEPTAGLDRTLRGLVARAVAQRAAVGVGVMVVTHDLAFAAEALDRALVLDRGRLACDAPLGELLGDAARLAPLGLVPPAVAMLSRALSLPGASLRAADVARGLASVARPPRPS
jgi:energy-coupling factor transport system ATP-binding protein